MKRMRKLIDKFETGKINPNGLVRELGKLHKDAAQQQRKGSAKGAKAHSAERPSKSPQLFVTFEASRGRGKGSLRGALGGRSGRGRGHKGVSGRRRSWEG